MPFSGGKKGSGCKIKGLFMIYNKNTPEKISYLIRWAPGVQEPELESKWGLDKNAYFGGSRRVSE